MAVKYEMHQKPGIEEADKLTRVEISAVYAARLQKEVRTPQDLKAFIFFKIPMPENRTEEDNIKFQELIKEGKI